jgi:hypothetical protein
MTSGIYAIDPDTPTGPIQPFKVYCDMTTEGGGWTLVMKIDGAKTTFGYDASQWTIKDPYNATAPGLDTTEAKLNSYSTVPFNEMLLEMSVSSVLKYIKVPVSGATSLYDMIADNQYRATSVGRAAWKSLINGSSIQANCNREGFNANVSSYAKARIGIINNQENDCNSPDSRLGFGTAGNNCGQNYNNSCGNEARCSPDNGEKSTYAFGYIMVR